MPKIFVASFNRASDGAVSKLIEKLDKEGMLIKSVHTENIEDSWEEPDYILACGDRKETFEFCLKQYQQNKPIIHLWAGEVSQGTHDEVYRWAITHMSMMQLCTNNEAAKRVVEFGYAVGKKTNEHVVGNVMLDNMEIDESKVSYYGRSNYDLVLYNPPTDYSALGMFEEMAEIEEIIEKSEYLWVPPNGDIGSDTINERHVNCTEFSRPQFLGLLKNCKRFITNSSCAEYEAQFLLKPEQIIHIGERNKNRESKHSDMTIPDASENIIKTLKTLDKKKWIKPECEHGKPNKYGWTVAYPENFILGENVDIGYGCYIQAAYGVVIDDDVQIGGGCYIYSDNTINKTHGEVHIAKGATVGANTVILPNVHIGENVYIPAGSVVTKDVPKNSSLLRVA